MRIAIGSTREVKVEAVREAWQVFASKILEDPDEEVNFLGYDVSNGGSSMPLTLPDLMRGARGRVESLMLQLKRERAEAEFYIGLEGGFNVVDADGPRRQAFLQSWAYVCDGHRGFFGHSGGVSVPSSIARPVIDRGVGLGIVLDRITARKEIPAGQETWGILTRDILTRRHSFVVALIAAFAPFYNPEAYRS